MIECCGQIRVVVHWFHLLRMFQKRKSVQLRSPKVILQIHIWWNKIRSQQSKLNSQQNRLICHRELCLKLQLYTVHTFGNFISKHNVWNLKISHSDSDKTTNNRKKHDALEHGGYIWHHNKTIKTAKGETSYYDCSQCVSSNLSEI